MDEWARRRWGAGAIARVVRRTPLTRGFSSPRVERLDLLVAQPHAVPKQLAVLRKTATPAEVAALRALRDVPGAEAFPELLDDGHDEDGPWALMPFYQGEPASSEPAIPVEVIESLARLHARYVDVPLPGIPVLDRSWWLRKCEFAVARLPDVMPPGPMCDQALELLREYAHDPTFAEAFELLPRTLVHGDVHANNVLVGGPRSKIIDWGGVYLAPAMLDVANLTTPEAANFQRYKAVWRDVTGADLEPDLARIGFHWATVCVNVKYLVFAARQLGVGAVGEMVERARIAMAELRAQPLPRK